MEAGFEDLNDKLPLYDRLGGRIFITLIADKFCDRIFQDSKLKDVVSQADPEQLRQSIRELGCSLLSGDTSYTISTLQEIGRQKIVSQFHFNHFISHLIAALVWAGVNRELIEETIDLVILLEDHLLRPDQPEEQGREE